MAETTPGATPPKRRGGRLKRWLIGVSVTLGVLAILFGGGVGVAEYRTSQPSFCASCHIMEPYYASWQADLHGRKLDVYCVECHYAPGQRTTVKAKLRGLSQVASYFSGRYGAGRPRAHVSNASCLTSKCHGDLDFMDKVIRIGTVDFTHAKHLQHSADEEKPNQQRLAELTEKLGQLVGKEHFAELEAVVDEAGPAEPRYAKLVSLCRDWNVSVDRDQLLKFSQLTNRKVRIAQLADLQCTNCHTYSGETHETGASGEVSASGETSAAPHPDHHFSVQTTTCYTCHFNNEAFNAGTARCLLCHEPPKKEITIHKELSPQASKQLEAPQLATEAVKMDHQEILARKVDCIACHADVAMDQAVVSRRDCQRCHDQEKFFAEWKQPLPLELVIKYHDLHVPEQRAKCLDCHSEIKHRLVRDSELQPHAGFLSSALANCTHCHPNHHIEQVDLLMGEGGRGVPRSDPNPMFGARTNCYGCHTKEAIGGRGSTVLKGAETTCIACHGEGYASTFEQWKAGVQLTLEDAEKAYTDARSALEKAENASPENRKKAEALLAIAQSDLELVQRGNGIHNVTYAIELLDSVTSHSRKATEALSP